MGGIGDGIGININDEAANEAALSISSLSDVLVVYNIVAPAGTFTLCHAMEYSNNVVQNNITKLKNNLTTEGQRMYDMCEAYFSFDEYTSYSIDCSFSSVSDYNDFCTSCVYSDQYLYEYYG